MHQRGETVLHLSRRAHFGAAAAVLVAVLCVMVARSAFGAADQFVGTTERDFRRGTDTADSMWGRDGADTLWGGPAGDTLYGENDGDTLIGDDASGAGEVGAPNGDDTLYGGAGDDEMAGGYGQDALIGGAGDDLMGSLDFTGIGGPMLEDTGGDAFDGGADNDTIFAGDGHDDVFGGPGIDSLVGAAGNDRLGGGTGNDSINGGAGEDRVVFIEAVTVDLGAGTATGEGTDMLADVEHVAGSSFADTIIGSSASNSISGGGGPDTITGADGVDVFSGDAGNDTIHARDGNVETVDCGTDVDAAIVDAEDNAAANCEAIDVPGTPSVTKLQGPTGRAASRTATFTFSATEKGATFACRLDAKEWGACASGVTFTNLANGSHIVRVRATDAGDVTGAVVSRSWVVDVIAPKVRSVAPAPGASGVARGANVVATFSEAMRPGTITGSSVSLVNTATGQAVAATVTYDSDDKRAVLNPKADLARGKTYRARVTRAVRDVAGNRLGSVESWIFTVKG